MFKSEVISIVAETHQHNYLTGAPWPVSSKAIQFAKSAILSAHSSCRAKRGGVRLDVLCPCLLCAVRHCQIQYNLVQVQLALQRCS